MRSSVTTVDIVLLKSGSMQKSMDKKISISRRNALKKLTYGMFAPMVLSACGSGGSSTAPQSVAVVSLRTPYAGEDALRIGYLLKTWMFQNEGLTLKKIEILDSNSSTLVASFVSGQNDWPTLYKDPLHVYSYLPQTGPLNAYYIPIQLKINDGLSRPQSMAHRLTFTRSGSTEEVIINGGIFTPQYTASPLVIPSPLRGNNLWFNNQGENGYHFDFLAFSEGAPYTGMMFAFDSMQLNDSQTSLLRDDGSKNVFDNNAYLNYGQTIYSVADGTVVRVIDGFDDQQGNRKIWEITEANLAGNNLIIDIGGGRYAFYAHCIKGSFGGLKAGDTVRKAQAIALLGNSGNSTGPHLHFEIFEGSQDPIWSRGVPFVIEQFESTATIESTDDATMGVTVSQYTAPQARRNVMPERWTVINVS